MRTKVLFGKLWALPTSMVGDGLVLLGAKPIDEYVGEELVGVYHVTEGSRLDRIFKKFQIAAMTLGDVMMVDPRFDTPKLRKHEYIHSRQAFYRWGPLFIPVYYIIMGYLYLFGKKDRKEWFYWEHPWEVEAQKAEEAP